MLSRRLPYAKVVQGCGKAKRKAENFIVERKHTDKLQFIGLTRMNINEKINGIINVQLMIINVQNKARSAP